MTALAATIGDPMLDLALSYAAQGWPVFPCRPADDYDPETGEVLPEKAPLISNGHKGATLNERVIRELWKRNPGALVGIPTGERSGFWVLDVDVPPKHEDGRPWLEHQQRLHGELTTKQAETGSGGLHFLFTHEHGIRNADVATGVETRGEGGYFIAPGSVMEDGRAYRWLTETPIQRAPQWLLDLLIKPKAAPAPQQRTLESAGASEIEEMLSYVSPDCSYQEWVSVLMAVHSALGEAGLSVADRWSAQGRKYRQGEVAKKWRGFSSEGGVNLGSLAELARQGGADLSDISRRHRPMADNDNTRLVDIKKMLERAREKAAKKAATEADVMPTKVDIRPDSVQDTGHNEPAIVAAPAAPGNQADLCLSDWPASRFVGEPAPVEWLVDGVIERGIPSMLAAMGEVGKSFAMLELCRRVAFGQQRSKLVKDNIMGGEVVAEGTAVFITGEDDARSVHRRLAALDPKGARYAERGDKLLVVPLPSAVGAVKPFWKDDRKKGPIETDEWLRLVEQLLAIDDLVLLGFDPLQLFAALQINEDPAAGQFVCGSIATLAAHTGANVMFTHHMAKRAKDILTPADARDAVRGSSAIVDGVRLAYGLWYPPVETARKICKELGEKYEPNKIVMGSVIKANGQASRDVVTYCRAASGLLVDVTTKKSMNQVSDDDLVEMLIGAIAGAAKGGSPFTKTGATGLFDLRERLNDDLRGLSRHKVETLCQRALDSGRIVRAIGKGSTNPKWLDVPTGPFAMGLGEFRAGMARAG